MAKAAQSSPQRKQHARAGAISLESPASRSARNINPSSASDLASAFSKNPHTDLTYSDSEDDSGYSNDDASSSAADVAARSGNLYHAYQTRSAVKGGKGEYSTHWYYSHWQKQYPFMSTKRKKKDEPVIPDDEEEYASTMQKKKKKKDQSPKNKDKVRRPPRGTKTSDGNKKKNKRSAD